MIYFRRKYIFFCFPNPKGTEPMLIKCPSCGLQSNCEPGKYLCKCGTVLDVAPDGTATVTDGPATVTDGSHGRKTPR